MLLNDSIIKLNYNPATDVLVTSMPDLRPYTLAEVSYYLDLIVESIRTYDIKNLLLDASKSVLDVEDETYKAITTTFAIALASTHLKKIARVGTTDIKREDKAIKLNAELRAELNYPIAYESFPNQDAAMAWLLTSAQD